MTEYIERTALYEVMNGQDCEFSLIDALALIEQFPAADVVEVRLGRWMDAESDDGCIVWHCSMCSYPVKTIGGYPIYRYCPMCATRMDKEAEHEIS